MKLFKHVGSSEKKNELEKIQKLFINLKSKIDNAKYRSRQTKSMVNTNNIMEEMYRLFEILKENLVEVYQNQSSFKQEI